MNIFSVEPYVQYVDIIDSRHHGDNVTLTVHTYTVIQTFTIRAETINLVDTCLSTSAHNIMIYQKILERNILLYFHLNNKIAR